jgi:uncharacterized protein (TIGR03435 family)
MCSNTFHAVVPHVGICAGGTRRLVSLPREIAGKLAYDVGRPVLNRTALKGQFDYVYFYQMAGAPSGDIASAGGTEQGPDLLEAVQHQLGLKLVPKKAPVPMFVIDEASKTPMEN